MLCDACIRPHLPLRNSYNGTSASGVQLHLRLDGHPRALKVVENRQQLAQQLRLRAPAAEGYLIAITHAPLTKERGDLLSHKDTRCIVARPRADLCFRLCTHRLVEIPRLRAAPRTQRDVQVAKMRFNIPLKYLTSRRRYRRIRRLAKQEVKEAKTGKRGQKDPSSQSASRVGAGRAP
eukprot:3777055-Pleurochrysis_carterae.AAC.7